MPETRIRRIEHYANDEQGGGLISVEEIPYEVSDEQLAIEADEKLLNDLLNMADSDIKVPQIGKILKALVKARR